MANQQHGTKMCCPKMQYDSKITALFTVTVFTQPSNHSGVGAGQIPQRPVLNNDNNGESINTAEMFPRPQKSHNLHRRVCSTKHKLQVRLMGMSRRQVLFINQSIGQIKILTWWWH